MSVKVFADGMANLLVVVALVLAVVGVSRNRSDLTGWSVVLLVVAMALKVAR